MLDDETIAQIAAGEVVERPTSVLKELIENSLDAGSTHLDIELAEGGFKSIRVTDNGWGMSESDLSLSVQRHATSKIRTARDLWQVMTFGFRGEALPSIAAVSRMEIVSRPPNSVDGRRLRLEGGQLLSLEPCGAPPGTSVIVRDIFYNTPARRKFQKTVTAETAMAADMVSRLALANPQVSFRLKLGDRLALQTSGNNKLLEVIAGVYGADLAKSMLPLEAEGISGYITPLSLTRNNRQRQTFIVNRRYIHSRLLTLAIDEAYRGKIPSHRFPAAVLRLEIAPELLDVNVHPSKLEIRFRDEQQIKASVSRVLEQALLEKRDITAHTTGRWSVWPTREDREPLPIKGRLFSDQPQSAVTAETDKDALKGATGISRETPSSYSAFKSGEIQGTDPTDCNPGNSLNDLLLLGQLDQTYLVAEAGGDLYLIDQHAAHERILFERIMDSLRKHPGVSQPLLFPEVVDMAPDERERFLQHILLFRNLGFIVEDFGGQTLLLRGAPAIIRSGARETFLDLVGVLGDLPGPAPHERSTEYLAKRLSCRQAIKAGQKLEREEMETLILDLEKTVNPMSCPHGRPTMIGFKQTDIQRRFYR